MSLEAQKEAKILIEGARRGRYNSLSLPFRELRSLPSLANLPYIKSLTLDASNLESLDELTQLPNLMELHITCFQWPQKTFFPELRKLRRLTFSSTLDLRIPMLHLPQIEHLDLSDVPISSLSAIRNLSKLKSLDLAGTRAANLAALEALPDIETLNLRYTPIRTLQPLRNLSRLRSLDLAMSDIVNVDGIENSRKLEQLDLSYTKVSDLTPLSNLIELKRLNLLGTKVLDLSPLKGLNKLDSIDLRHTDVSDMRPLAKLSNLSDITFAACPLSDEILIQLSKLGGDERTRRTKEYLRELVGVSDPGSDIHEETDLQLAEKFRQDPLGARATISGDSFALTLATDDKAVLDERVIEQYRKEALRKVSILASRAKRVANDPIWSDLPEVVRLFGAEMARDQVEFAGRSMTLWALSVSLATFLEQARNIRIESPYGLDTLPADVERALADLVVTAAPFVRMFSTPQKFDSALFDFAADDRTISAARSLAREAGRLQVLSDSDTALVSATLNRVYGRGMQSQKANGFGVKTTLNVLAAAFLFIWGGGLKKIANRVAEDSVSRSSLAKKASDLLVSKEDEVMAIFSGSAPDLQETARELIAKGRGIE